MKTIDWKVFLLHPPAAARYCKRCGKRTEFIPSGLFRVNAQKKDMDVWLIYKCAVCDTTWNLTVHSRVNPRSLPPGALNGYMGNEAEYVLRCAVDTALIRRNGAEPGLPEVELIGADVTPHEPVELHIAAEQPLEIRPAALLRKKLGLTRSAYDRMLTHGQIVCVSGHDLTACRLCGEMVIQIHP